MPNNTIPSCCEEMFSRFMSDEKLRKDMKEKFEKFAGSNCAEYFARMRSTREEASKESKGERNEEQSKA